VKEVLSNKSGLLEKPRLIMSRLLDDGLISHEGEKWAKHRKIINPAFHIEKLKVINSINH
jgi:cytochrome P450